MLLPLAGGGRRGYGGVGVYGQKSNDSPLSKPAVVPSNLDHGCLASAKAVVNGGMTESRYVFYRGVGGSR